MAEGIRIIERDEKGHFVKTEIDPAYAAEMGRLGHDKQRKLKLETLLSEAGYESIEDCPQHLRSIAELAVSGRSGAVAAMRDFLKLTGRPVPNDKNSGGAGGAGGAVAHNVTLKIGQKCPTCHQRYNPYVAEYFSDFVIRTFVEILDAIAEQKVERGYNAKTNRNTDNIFATSGINNVAEPSESGSEPIESGSEPAHNDAEPAESVVKRGRGRPRKAVVGGLRKQDCLRAVN